VGDRNLVDICFLTPRFPFPTTKGDKLRVYHAIRRLSRKHSITLVAAADEPLDEAALSEVRQYCELMDVVPVGGAASLLSILAKTPTTRLPLQALFYDTSAFRRATRDVLARKRFDVIFASTIRVAPQVWDERTPVVMDLMDAFSRGLEMRRGTVAAPLRVAYDFERRRLQAYEMAACAHFPRLVVCAEADRVALGSERVSVVRTCADLEQFRYVREGRADDVIVMTGNMGYQPNVDAVIWFVENVWPKVRAAHAAARFQVVGARPSAAVRALAERPGVEVVGPVAEIAPYLERATLAVTPTRGGTGLQTTVLEAMATGTPIVATSFANEGIGARPDCQLLIADDPEGFARAVARLLEQPALRDSLSIEAHAYVAREFSWDTQVERLEGVFGEAIERTAKFPGDAGR
jgi:sugar transferase (PEP-CTERM/EpsH1 system associated)